MKVMYIPRQAKELYIYIPIIVHMMNIGWQLFASLSLSLIHEKSGKGLVSSQSFFHDKVRPLSTKWNKEVNIFVCGL
jgi:hypothetical protein